MLGRTSCGIAALAIAGLLAVAGAPQAVDRAGVGELRARQAVDEVTAANLALLLEFAIDLVQRRPSARHTLVSGNAAAHDAVALEQESGGRHGLSGRVRLATCQGPDQRPAPAGGRIDGSEPRLLPPRRAARTLAQRSSASVPTGTFTATATGK